MNGEQAVFGFAPVQAKDLRPQARLGSVLADVFELLRGAGSEGLTSEEVEQALGLRHQTASARIRELVQAGRVRDSGRRRQVRSGRWARVWVAT